ncbi:uncharacterized protein LOC116178639 [Photinus pyralis]|uniref:uncharacterized protein LOC116178639 n=1 Tax=Photinus pyralis TaxID=7054 RepID=UPI0012670529|nr:uncharacterized protein LOC116178639 [Photinus pyralis]
MCTYYWRLLIFGVFVVNFFGKGCSLECFDCKSDPKGHCGDPFNSSSVKAVSCVPSSYVCLKQKQIFKRNGREIMEVTRSCAPDSYCRLMIFEHCSLCQTDRCNPANVSLPSSPVNTIIAMCLLIKYFSASGTFIT